MIVRNLQLLQFRNYASFAVSFNEKIVCICGPNGCGKTNLADAIHYLCFTKSYFSKPENTNAYENDMGFRIEGLIGKSKATHHIVCIYRETGRKEFYVDDVLQKKFSAHIGKFPCIFIAPDDMQLLTGPSENRRNFFDSIISQTDHHYLKKIIEYRQVLDQRNSFLKSVEGKFSPDQFLMDAFHDQLVDLNNFIFEKRKIFFHQFVPMAMNAYIGIAGKTDGLSINYSSQLQEESIDRLLRNNVDRDLYLQRTGHGIHKDDLVMLINNLSFKNTASQGQRKSLLFALKLAAFEIIKEMKGLPPILLLDDIFEKLDAVRMQQLLHKVCIENQGQVFITDTHEARMRDAMDALALPYQLINLEGS